MDAGIYENVFSVAFYFVLNNTLRINVPLFLTCSVFKSFYIRVLRTFNIRVLFVSMLVAIFLHDISLGRLYRIFGKNKLNIDTYESVPYKE